MRTLILTVAICGLAGAGFGQAQPGPSTSATQSTSAQAGQSGAAVNASASGQTSSPGAAVNSGVAIQAELTKGLDAKKAKQGDPVMAKCTKEVNGKGGFSIPKNAKLIGHVTEVQARGRGQGQSMLAIAFDKAQLKDGREIPLQAVIQAIAPPPSMAMEMDNSGQANEQASAPGSGPRPVGGGALGGVGSTVNSTTSAATGVAGNSASTVGNVGAEAGSAASGTVGAAANSSLSAASTGVIGMKGLQLDTNASTATQGSVIRSNSDNVRLESGTRLVLRLTAQ